jgi:hypothetical protein
MIEPESCLRKKLGIGKHRISSKYFAVIYLFIAIPSLLILNIVFPSYHAPDDTDHVKRASTLISGQWLPATMPGRSSGAFIDTGLKEYMDAQIPIIAIKMRPLDEKHKIAYRQDGNIYWTDSGEFSEAPAAMSYFPILYAPQSLALGVGRSTGMSVKYSILFARMINSLSGALLVALGLRLLPQGHAVIIVTMLLPKSLVQFASNSADPIILGASIVLIALVVQAWRSERVSTTIATYAALLLAIAAAVRPPLVGLSVPLLLRALCTRSWRSFAILTLSILAVVAWFAMIFPSIIDLRCGDVGSTSAKAFYFAWNWPNLIGHSIAQNSTYYLQSFIGELGWGNGPMAELDKPLPLLTYILSIEMLLYAAFYDRTCVPGLPAKLRLGLISAALIMVLLVFFAMYTVCTSQTLESIRGVQGRYFAPSIAALAPALAGRTNKQSPGGAHVVLIPALIFWCFVNLATLCFEGYKLYWQL